jgi:phytol kinase
MENGMFLDPFFSNKLVQDIVAAVITLAVALGWLRLMDAFAHRGVIGQQLSRKIIHIGTGPLYVLCWTLFSQTAWARWLAALVPLLITVQFFLVGTGRIQDPAAVQAMSRTGDPREILRGPLYYGIVFVVVTLLFWRESPVGIVALMLMCGGDGLADVIGRRLGRRKLPFSREKSWAGSLAMLGGGFLFSAGFVVVFSAWNVFAPALSIGPALGVTAAIALVGTIVESLPMRDVDNITTTAAAILCGLALFPMALA